MSAKLKGNLRIRIKDIAKKANVSIGTVDRVLHDRGEVKEETRDKVMAIVEEMGYTPNLLAKSLSSKKAINIAVIIPEAGENNPYWKKPLSGMLSGAEEIQDFNVNVDVCTFNATNVESFKQCVEKVMQSKPNGVVFNPVFKEASVDFTGLLDEAGIPYIYLDTDMDSGSSLSYIGQNAIQSGRVAARIFSRTVAPKSTILIVKLANGKEISSHLKKREEGFRKFFRDSSSSNYTFISVEIDLMQKDEPATSLNAIFDKIDGVGSVFVPSSRVFKVAEYVQEHVVDTILLAGYDLVEQNVKFLESGHIDFLISQKPEEQGYKSIMAMFNQIVLRKKIQAVNYSPIDIIINENIEYYSYG